MQAWIMRGVSERGLKNVVFKPCQPRDKLSLNLCVPDESISTPWVRPWSHAIQAWEVVIAVTANPIASV
jgi:hypothetical protein